jgi:hypothetical protein
MLGFEVGDIVGEFRSGRLVILRDNSTRTRWLILDLEEAAALRDWLNKVLPHE